MYPEIPITAWSYTRNYPVRIYYKEGRKRIIFTSGLATHNVKWIPHLTPDDSVICLLPFSPDYKHLQHEFSLLTHYKYNLENWHILCNTTDQFFNCKLLGLNCAFVNHNCFLDESRFPIIQSIERQYDAIYNARLEPWKRHSLAVKLNNLALITGWQFADQQQIDLATIPYTWRNDQRLSESEICAKVQEASCGLILSEKEGACYASSEYLLCGLPVVSTPSLGGRDVWYNNYNSVICEATSDGVRIAVEQIKDRWANGIDREKIRLDHIRLAWEHRMNFVDLLQRIFKQAKITTDPYRYFTETFKHKMLEEYVDENEVCQRLEIDSF